MSSSAAERCRDTQRMRQASATHADTACQSISCFLKNTPDKATSHSDALLHPNYYTLSDLSLFVPHSVIIPSSVLDAHWLFPAKFFFFFHLPVSLIFILSPQLLLPPQTFRNECVYRESQGRGEQKLILINDRLAVRRFGQRLKLVRIDSGF